MTMENYEHPETFVLSRGSDESGVSGTGMVVEGVVFTDGTVVARWLTKTPTTEISASIVDFLRVHVTSHPTNASILTFNDGTVWDQKRMEREVNRIDQMDEILADVMNKIPESLDAYVEQLRNAPKA